MGVQKVSRGEHVLKDFDIKLSSVHKCLDNLKNKFKSQHSAVNVGCKEVVMKSLARLHLHCTQYYLPHHKKMVS